MTHDIRISRLAAYLAVLGPRACQAFIEEIVAAHPGMADDIRRRLEAYDRIDSDQLAELGLDKARRPPLLHVKPE